MQLEVKNIVQTAFAKIFTGQKNPTLALNVSNILNYNTLDKCFFLIFKNFLIYLKQSKTVCIVLTKYLKVMEQSYFSFDYEGLSLHVSFCFCFDFLL